MSIIAILQIVLSIALVVLILMQRNEAALGSAFGGGGDDGGLHRTRRGPERAMFLLTIGIAIAYAVLSVVVLLLN